jgi:hypothetical protein
MVEPLGSLVPDHDQGDAGGECQRTEDRWKRDRLLLLDRGLEGAQVDDLLAGRVGDSPGEARTSATIRRRRGA